MPGLSGDGSFERSTGIDLRTDIGPRSLPALEGNRDVDERSFGADDVLAVRFDTAIPGRLRPAERVTLRDQLKDLSSGGREQFSFEINFEPAPEQLGQYSLRISLGQERRATTPGSIAVR